MKYATLVGTSLAAVLNRTNDYGVFSNIIMRYLIQFYKYLKAKVKFKNRNFHLANIFLKLIIYGKLFIKTPFMCKIYSY